MLARDRGFYNGEMDPRHCIESFSPTIPWDEWVQADLIVYGDSLVIHKVNGKTVLEYTKPQIGGEVANGYDPEIKIDGKRLSKGYIALQAEGQGVLFKDIKIKDLAEKNIELIRRESSILLTKNRLKTPIFGRFGRF